MLVSILFICIFLQQTFIEYCLYILLGNFLCTMFLKPFTHILSIKSGLFLVDLAKKELETVLYKI